MACRILGEFPERGSWIHRHPGIQTHRQPGTKAELGGKPKSTNRKQSTGRSCPFGDRDCTGRLHSLDFLSRTHAATPGLSSQKFRHCLEPAKLQEFPVGTIHDFTVQRQKCPGHCPEAQPCVLGSMLGHPCPAPTWHYRPHSSLPQQEPQVQPEVNLGLLWSLESLSTQRQSHAHPERGWRCYGVPCGDARDALSLRQPSTRGHHSSPLLAWPGQ